MNSETLEVRYGPLFQRAFENASLGIVISSREKGYSLVNHAFTRLVGYTQTELFNKTFEDITHPEDLPKNRELVSQLLKREIPFYEYEKRFIRKDQSIVWVKVHTSLIDLDTDKDAMFIIVRNIESEIKVRVEQKKLLTLVENSVELMSILELDGKNSYLNKAGREMLGFEDMDEVLKTPIEKLHTPENFAQVEREVLPSVMGTGKWSGAMLVRHLKTGEVFPVFNNTVRIDDPATGKPLAVGAVMRDLRADLAAQSALHDSEKRLRIMIEQAPVAIGLMRGRDMIIEAANDSILELWGKRNVVGLTLMQALPELAGQPFLGLLQEVYDTGVPYYGYETKAVLQRSKGMEDCFFNFVYAPVHENGKISGVIVVATEVTQQVKARAALEESEQRFRNLIMEAPMATAVYVGENMIIQLANDAMISLWGKDKSVIGKPVLDAIPEIRSQEFPALLRQVYETGIPYHSADHKAELVVDGKLQSFYFNFTYKPLKDTSGNVYGILNMAVDVTKQKLIADELEKSVAQRTVKLKEANAHLENVNRNLEQFAYITSHDLQEPLRKIRIFANVLETKYKNEVPSEVANYLSKISTSSKRMSDLIQDVLAFSRVESHAKKFSSVNLSEIFHLLLEDYDLKIKEKNAKVVTGELPTIEAIPLQMNQLFYNILGNALKFTRPEIPVEISISSRMLPAAEVAAHTSLFTDKVYYEIAIADNGIGFDQSFADNIFTIFQRLHTREAYEGTGIGLAICRKIVLLHNGLIFAKSREGAGSTFYVILPVKQ